MSVSLSQSGLGREFSLTTGNSGPQRISHIGTGRGLKDGAHSTSFINKEAGAQGAYIYLRHLTQRIPAHDPSQPHIRGKMLHTRQVEANSLLLRGAYHTSL